MRGTESRIVALLILLWADFLSWYLLRFVHTNQSYLFVCVNFSFLTLLIILKAKPTAIMVDISALMFGQMLIHVIAWLCVILSLYPYFYHDAISMIVIITYLRLLWIGKNDGNTVELPSWLLFLRNYNLVSFFAKGVQK
jgi:hypothetical protein